jgi:hypothetical protein
MNCDRLYRIGFVCMVSAALGATGILRADSITLDPAQYNAQFGGQDAGDAPGDYSNRTSIANISTQPDPSAFVSTNGGSSVIQLTYYFDVNYSLTGVPVEVVINAPQYISAIGAPLSQASEWGMTSQLIGISYQSIDGGPVSDYDYQSDVLDCAKYAGYTDIVCPDGFIQQSPTQMKLEVLTNEEALIAINVAVNFPTGGIAEAYVDPYITFDPSFNSTGYSLSFSDGISNLVPTPEPSTIVPSACGLLLVWIVRRRFDISTAASWRPIIRAIRRRS